MKKHLGFLLILCFIFVACNSNIKEDYTKNDPINCPKHDVALTKNKVDIMYGMPSEFVFQELAAADSLFPYAKDFSVGGCMIEDSKYVILSSCTACVEARDIWRKENKPSDQ